MCAAKANNEFSVEILQDGSIKITTGVFDGARHAAAEALMRAIAAELGPTTRARNPHAHTHHHDHEHEHEHNKH